MVVRLALHQDITDEHAMRSTTMEMLDGSASPQCRELQRQTQHSPGYYSGRRCLLWSPVECTIKWHWAWCPRLLVRCARTLASCSMLGQPGASTMRASRKQDFSQPSNQICNVAACGALSSPCRWRRRLWPAVGGDRGVMRPELGGKSQKPWSVMGCCGGEKP